MFSEVLSSSRSHGGQGEFKFVLLGRVSFWVVVRAENRSFIELYCSDFSRRAQRMTVEPLHSFMQRTLIKDLLHARHHLMTVVSKTDNTSVHVGFHS